jgi:WD40 repeat protein
LKSIAKGNPSDDKSKSLKLRRKLDAEGHDLRAIAWSPDGASILGISGNSSAWLWDTENGEVRWNVNHPSGVPSCLAWSPDGRYWAVGSWQGSVQLLGASAGAAYGTVRGLSSGAVGVGWSPAGDAILAISTEGQSARWDMYSGRELSILDVGFVEGINLSAAWSPDLQSIAITSAAGRVECRSAVDSRLIWATNDGESGSINCVTWSPDGQFLACAAEGRLIRVWQHQEALELWNCPRDVGNPWHDNYEVIPPSLILDGLHSGTTWTSFSADGKLLAARTRTEILHLWRCDSWEKIAEMKGEIGDWTNGTLISFHPREPRLATVSGKGSVVEIWDIYP